MRRVTIDDSNYSREFEASASAIRDFLYTYFEISADCLPVGDWDRAELGSVDPFRYVDVEFVPQAGFRGHAEVAFLREGAAVNLLCRLADAHSMDECGGSTQIADFCSAVARGTDDAALRALSPELQAIYRAYADGRVASMPSIQSAFAAWLAGDADAFYVALQTVRAEVIVPVFTNLGR